MMTLETHTMCVGPLIAPTGRPVDQDRASRTDKDRCKHQAAVEHADTTPAITAIARRSARRQGLADHRRLLARFNAAVGVTLARRSARMVHACLRELCKQALRGSSATSRWGIAILRSLVPRAPARLISLQRHFR